LLRILETSGRDDDCLSIFFLHVAMTAGKQMAQIDTSVVGVDWRVGAKL
jgi:hypothetical protein